MIQIYATYQYHFFLFNIQQAMRYKWQVFDDKTGLHLFADVFMQLTLKTLLSQTKYCILSPFQV